MNCFQGDENGLFEDNVKENKNPENTTGSRKKKKTVQRDENYISHFASDQHTEAGLVKMSNVIRSLFISPN